MCLVLAEFLQKYTLHILTPPVQVRLIIGNGRRKYGTRILVFSERSAEQYISIKKKWYNNANSIVAYMNCESPKFNNIQYNGFVHGAK